MFHQSIIFHPFWSTPDRFMEIPIAPLLRLPRRFGPASPCGSSRRPLGPGINGRWMAIQWIYGDGTNDGSKWKNHGYAYGRWGSSGRYSQESEIFYYVWKMGCTSNMAVFHRGNDEKPWVKRRCPWDLVTRVVAKNWMLSSTNGDTPATRMLSTLIFHQPLRAWISRLGDGERTAT